MTISGQIRFALIGCGHIAERHAKHLAQIEGARLDFCFDSNAERSLKLSEDFKASSTSSLDELLNMDFDVAIIATPNASHCDIAAQCVKSGKHVLIEKPMDIDSAKAERLIELAREEGRKLFVVKQNRYNPPVSRLKALIDKGELGKIHSLSLHCFWNRNEAYYSQSAWRGTKALDGGSLFTQFSHFIDILYYLFGKVSESTGYIKRCREGDYLEFEDNAAFSFITEEGVPGSLSYSTTSFDKNMEGSLTILAERCSVKVGGRYLNSIEYVSGLEDEFKDLEYSRPANDYGYYEGSMSNHDKVIMNLIANLKGEEEIMTSGEDGLEVVKMIEQFYASAVELK